MITWVDWGIWLIYLFVILTVFWFYRNSKNEIEYKWFFNGILIKVFGSLAFALTFVYYYKFGDSFEYYKGAVMLSNTLLDSPSDYFELLGHESSTNFPGHLRQYTDPLAYSDTPEEWFMVKLTSIFSLISFNSYLVINLFMSVVSFWGGWKLFKVFSDLIPSKTNLGFYAVFFIPSMIFWGSGLMKDTFTLAGINYMIYVLYFGVIKSQFKPIYFIGLFIWLIISFTLKSYIVLAFFPSIILVFYYNYKAKISSPIIKLISVPMIFTSLLIIGFFSLKTLSESSQKYSAEQLEWKVKGFHSWHTTLGGSAYDLGVTDYTPSGVLSKIPAGLNVTFFRPYLWEAKNPVVLLGALESLIIFLLFLTVIWQSKFKPLKYIKNTILLKSLITFILIFGFAVGFTSYNFGALGRYKMPIMSIFVFTIFYILNQIKTKKLT